MYIVGENNDYLLRINFKSFLFLIIIIVFYNKIYTKSIYLCYQTLLNNLDAQLYFKLFPWKFICNLKIEIMFIILSRSLKRVRMNISIHSFFSATVKETFCIVRAHIGWIIQFTIDKRNFLTSTRWINNI